MASSPTNDSVMFMRYSANKPPIRTRRQSTGACDRRCSVVKATAAAEAAATVTSDGCSGMMPESVTDNRLVIHAETVQTTVIDQRSVDEQLRRGYIVESAEAVTSCDWWTSFDNLLRVPFGFELFTVCFT